MVTSEFIIGHSADDAAEKKGEPRKILIALLAALLLHLVIGYLIAVSGGLFSSHAVAEEEKPIELSFVDLSTPAPVTKKNPMFMETDESKKTVEPPKEQTFESNANSVAASQQPATGDIPLPSQQGKDRPAVDLDTHQYTLANQGAQPQPSAPPQETPKPSEAPTPQPTSTPQDQLAMLRPTPTPTPESRPSSTPQQRASSYQAYKEQTRLSGRITNRGISSVNALGTPRGRYLKFLLDAIGSRWYSYVERQGDLVSIGTARLVFDVDRSGQVKNLKVVENTANEAFANICIQSVQEAQIPPMSDDLATTLPPEGMEMDIPFTIFANR
jgi:outer membrane biosynthesis protein TonB